MKWIGTVLREIYGLFVDDLVFTFSILAWLGVVWSGVVAEARMHRPEAAWLPALLLFAGLAGILLESALRYARSRTRH